MGSIHQSFVNIEFLHRTIQTEPVQGTSRGSRGPVFCFLELLEVCVRLVLVARRDVVKHDLHHMIRRETNKQRHHIDKQRWKLVTHLVSDHQTGQQKEVVREMPLVQILGNPVLAKQPAVDQDDQRDGKPGA